jgi:hypothetical protein
MTPEERVTELRDYVTYLRWYICELAHRTDISSLPYSIEDWRRSEVAQATRGLSRERP